MKIFDSMKLNSMIWAAGVAAVVASCAQVSDVTEITGTVVPEGVDQVQVTVGEQIDTLVPVVDGKFTLTLPTDVCQLGTVAAGQYGLNFIPDGTPLNVVLDVEPSITSEYPKISVQAKLNAYLDAEDAYVAEYRAKRTEIFQADSLSDEDKTALWAEFEGPFFEKYNKANSDAYTQEADGTARKLTAVPQRNAESYWEQPNPDTWKVTGADSVTADDAGMPIVCGKAIPCLVQSVTPGADKAKIELSEYSEEIYGEVKVYTRRGDIFDFSYYGNPSRTIA